MRRLVVLCAVVGIMLGFVPEALAQGGEWTLLSCYIPEWSDLRGPDEEQCRDIAWAVLDSEIFRRHDDVPDWRTTPILLIDLVAFWAYEEDDQLYPVEMSVMDYGGRVYVRFTDMDDTLWVYEYQYADTTAFARDALQVTETALGEHYAGIERGTSEEGMPQLGSPDAPVTIHNYSSFTCPHCATFHDNQFVELLSEIRAGEVRFVFVPVSNQSSAPATAAAFCAEEQGRFWEMHDLLFSWLGQYGGSAFAQARLVQGAEGLGLDTEAFSACLNAPETQARIEEANALWFALAQAYQGQPNEVTGTPTLTFNGVPPEWGSGAPNIETIRQVIAQVSGG